MKKPPKWKHTEWRVLAQGPGSKQFDHREPVVEFDELVVGEWFHIERMDNRAWWMRVGGVTFWVNVPRTGKALVTITEGDEHLESWHVATPPPPRKRKAGA